MVAGAPPFRRLRSPWQTAPSTVHKGWPHVSETRAPSVALVSTEPDRCIRRVREALPPPADVRVAPVDQLASLPPRTAVVVDARDLPRPSLLVAAKRAVDHPDRTLFLVPAAQSESLTEELASAGGLRHVLAEPVRPLDLHLTLRRVCGAEPFPVQAYLPATPFAEHALAGVHDRPGALQQVERAAEDHGLPGRLTELALTVAEELITNALYNAPVSPGGDPLYRHLSRAEPLPDPVRPPGRFEVGCDGATLVIAVRDAFGSLLAHRIPDDLRRMVQPRGHRVVDGAGGAGLGLVMAYHSVEHLHIDLVPGRSTQVIGIIGLTGGFRRFARAGHSFNLFIGEGP